MCSIRSKENTSSNIYYAHKNKYLACQNQFHNICDELRILQMLILLTHKPQHYLSEAQEMDYKAISLTIDVEGGYEGKYVSVHSLLQRSQRVVGQLQ